MVVSELRGEKIDIIPYNDEPARFVAKALSPARVREVLVDDDGRQATVIVPDDQLSLAIGREGQNARLAARLTGWRIDIRSETEFAQEEQEGDYEEGQELDGRCHAILTNGRRCPNAALPQSRYCGLDAHQALAEIGSDNVADLAGGNGDVPADVVEAGEVAVADEPVAEEPADPVAEEATVDEPEAEEAVVEEAAADEPVPAAETPAVASDEAVASSPADDALEPQADGAEAVGEAATEPEPAEERQ
jgi:N utilization substance protein A